MPIAVVTQLEHARSIVNHFLKLPVTIFVKPPRLVVGRLRFGTNVRSRFLAPPTGGCLRFLRLFLGHNLRGRLNNASWRSNLSKLTSYTLGSSCGRTWSLVRERNIQGCFRTVGKGRVFRGRILLLLLGSLWLRPSFVTILTVTGIPVMVITRVIVPRIPVSGFLDINVFTFRLCRLYFVCKTEQLIVETFDVGCHDFTNSEGLLAQFHPFKYGSPSSTAMNVLRKHLNVVS